MTRTVSSNRKLLLSTALGTGNSLLVMFGAAMLAPSAAQAQCVPTSPDLNCTYVFNPGQKSGDDTGASAPPVLNMHISPPTNYNGSTNAGGIIWYLKGQQGGNATHHGETGGTGGNGAQQLILTVDPGVSVVGNGFNAINLFTGGGGAGAAYYGLDSMPTPAYAGSSGTVTMTLNGKVTATATSLAVAGQSVGGAGGNAHDGGVGEYASNGGSGSAGQAVTLTQGGSITASAAGVYLYSAGGAGQNGGNDNAGITQVLGGDGGDGGDAGAVTYTLNSGGMLTAGGGWGAQLVSVAADGGAGGVGKDKNNKIIGGSGGNGGDGGYANTVTATINGALTVNGAVDVGLFNGMVTGIGLLAQSFGGNGGNGGNAGVAVGGGGGGGYSRPGGTINLSGTGSITTLGTADSQGILAQSLGGGGGIGGNVTGGAFAVGGDGGLGSDGGPINVNVGLTINTSGKRSAGIAAQAIGGGGGAGGSASGTSVVANYLIGGAGGPAGNGGAIDATSSGQITTSGAHSSAMVLQSIGGGGGSGGSVVGKTISGFAGSSVSLGGNGGGGGSGSTVGQFTDGNNNPIATNTGLITTSGTDSFGILGQSIGGGGGVGGNSSAEAKVYSTTTDPQIPTISIAVALGGSGGPGGSGSTVTLANAGLIATTGAGGLGILGQSIGGGGGSGGDSSAVATAKGSSDDSVNVSTSITAGGNAGGAGNGGAVNLANSGMIITTGQAGDAMIGQSIGGGGGNGGGADGQAKSSGDGTNISAEVSLGGQASSGGGGGVVRANNSGALITLGDGASGIMMQTIGGGGGRGGGAAGTANGDFSAKVNIGGNGGNGGSPDQGNGVDSINIANGGSIVTFGGDAPAIIAQSIGGGGGNGGKAASSLGSPKSTKDGGNGQATTTSPVIATVAKAFADGGLAQLTKFNSTAGLTMLANCLLGNTTGCQSNVSARLGDAESDADGLNDLGGSAGDSGDGSDSDSITVQIGVGTGGKGGGGGAAGQITITNTGSIGTVGAMSDGILAQAIGGGGGKGGAAISSTTSADVQGSISVGGQGGAGGDGALISVTNSGSIITTKQLAAGIVVQSIAGGGGIGGASGAKVKPNGDSDSSVLSLPISIGGTGGGGGTSGQAIVSSSGAIITQSHDAIGIIAQSVAGGGGIVKTLSTDASDNNGGAATASGSDYDINLKFGGSSGSGANGGSGLVNVTTTAGGTITTKGDNAYGILAQSIAGGGGLVLGGKPEGNTTAAFFGTGTTAGSVINDPTNNPGNSGLTVSVGADITTGFKQKDGTVTGKGASAVIAQSIGGGGGLAGDTGWTQQHFAFSGGAANRTGNGGVVDVTVQSGVNVNVIGDNTTAIIAQSIGGGGGYIANKSGLFTGTAGGHGYGGNVTVTNYGTISVSGAYAIGVFAQSDGDGSQRGQIIVNNHGTINGSASNYAVYFDHGENGTANNNALNNWGTIASAGGAGGYAVYGNAGFVYITNSGNITGQIHLTDNGGNGYVANGGTITSSSIDVGTNCPNPNCGVSNVGVIDMRSASGAAKITGNYVGKAGSSLVLDADFAKAKGTLLTIDGNATFDGKVDVRATSMTKTPVKLVNTTGKLTLANTLQSSATPAQLFDYKLETDGKSLTVTPQAHLSAQASSLGSTRKAVADHLQTLFDSGTDLGGGFTRLASLATPAAYSDSLRSISGVALGSMAAYRFQASRRFVSEVNGGCDLAGEASCTWARVQAGRTIQDETANALGYNANYQVFEMGAQTRIGEGLSLGGAVGYESSKLRDDQRTARMRGDTMLAAIGLHYRSGPLELIGAIDGGYGWYTSKRQIAVSGATDLVRAKPRLWNLGVNASATYMVSFGKSYLKPFAEVRGANVHADRFTETGNSVFALDVARQSNFAVSGTIGSALGTTIAFDGQTSLRPFVSAGVEFAGNTNWKTRSRFVGETGGDPFTVETRSPGTFGRFGVGMDIVSGSRFNLVLSYNPEVGSHYNTQQGVARLTYRF